MNNVISYYYLLGQSLTRGGRGYNTGVTGRLVQSPGNLSPELWLHCM